MGRCRDKLIDTKPKCHFLVFGFGLCGFGGVFNMRRTVRSNRSSAPGSVSISSGSGFFGGFTMAIMPEFDMLLRAVGSALTNWSFVETGLFRVFHEAICCPALGPSSAAFVAVENYRAKLSMTDAALRSSKSFQPHTQTWEALQERCISESKERNRLAHSKTTFPR